MFQAKTRPRVLHFDLIEVLGELAWIERSNLEF